MKVAAYHRYGSPDVVQIEEVDKPVLKADQVLIEVRAASINPLDYHFVRGIPYVGRLMTGLRKPRLPRLGVDVAGVVEAVGSSVTAFKPGDEVFGNCRGALAEYACAAEADLVAKPADMTFEQAAAIPVAAFTALQGLRDKGRVRPGQKVLINGAAGGVGTFAVQIAKWLGAHVTGVCSTRNVDLVRSLGADRVIDYTQEDFTRGPEKYDLIFDCIGNHPVRECRRVSSAGAVYMAVGAKPGRWIAPIPRMLGAALLSRFVRPRVSLVLARRSREDLKTLCDLVREGKVTPVIDSRYRLSETSEAIRYLLQGHARGKVVITST
ncbi:MAG TPA: NAD(P)-dependent alcohol dehydrogenase [Thermoanaerobaculia bacterium]|nr:NAD(P)-dependent alcohol dehydrogenase [Thermoanaerobaculia bacterium]